MSYVSLLKNIPEIISQPTGIAAIASLGIHGAIALIVPLMPVESNKANESPSSKAVGVMELSQADQNRLPNNPNTSPQSQLPVASQFPIPPQVPPVNLLGDQAKALAALPPPPASTPFLPPPIPKSLGQYSVSPLPKGQSLQITPKGNLGFDTSSFNTNQRFSSRVPPFNNSDIKLGAAKPLPIDKLPTLPAAKIPDGLPNSPETNLTAPEPATQPDNEQLIARIDKTPQTGDNLSLAGESLPQWQQGTAPQLPNELPTNTTGQVISQVNSYEDLRKTVQQEYPSVEEKAVIRDTISTDKPELEGAVLGGLVVDPDGKVLEIKFQDKSVSRDLQLKAREYFSANPPKGHQKTSYYPFSLQFQNDKNSGANQGTVPTPAVTNPAVNNKQPIPAPAVTNPAVNNKQPIPAPAVTNPAVNNKQPIPAPAVTNPAVNNKQPVPAPAVTIKPLSNPVINNKQPVPAPASTNKPSPAVNDDKNEPVTVVEPDKKLIQQLREFKEQKEKAPEGQ
ncbi:hypothetical protein [Fortiea contorta]|uniref:hypothetical protein n=1 Tax=Fortiea contorta TaxID=1892405 RepID=UPI000349A16D|nr:hypothetical protein [Fortiea contorta]